MKGISNSNVDSLPFPYLALTCPSISVTCGLVLCLSLSHNILLPVDMIFIALYRSFEEKQRLCTNYQ